MLLPILHDVDVRSPHFARSAEASRVVPVAEDLPAATEGAIDRSRHPNDETLYPTPEIERAVGFQQQMQMVHLHAEVQDSERRAGRVCECSADGAEDAGVAQRRQSLAGA